jgi:hypothetical protein
MRNNINLRKCNMNNLVYKNSRLYLDKISIKLIVNSRPIDNNSEVLRYGKAKSSPKIYKQSVIL